jgi:hypothetical protein
MENRLDDLFKEKLSKHEERPSQEAWDQIHGRLRSKKKAAWGKRLAIAASIILMATVGFLGYGLIKNIGIDQSTKTISLNNELEETGANTVNQYSEQQQEEATDLIQNIKNASTETSQDTEQEDYEAVSNVEDKDVMEVIGQSSENDPVLANNKLQIRNELPVNEQPMQAAELNANEALLESVGEVEGDDQVAASKQEAQKPKQYPKVKIIYRASENSELVASGKTSIIDKGLNKITQFSEEHLLTDNRKTMLRNTKEDLLALNFGKLLNKSNRELEN